MSEVKDRPEEPGVEKGRIVEWVGFDGVVRARILRAGEEWPRANRKPIRFTDCELNPDGTVKRVLPLTERK